MGLIGNQCDSNNRTPASSRTSRDQLDSRFGTHSRVNTVICCDTVAVTHHHLLHNSYMMPRPI